MSVALEARLLGLTHRKGCPADRVEVYTESRPGAMIRGSGRGGPSRRGPAVPLRAVRCVDCGMTALREIGQREQLATIAAVIDAKEQARDRARG